MVDYRNCVIIMTSNLGQHVIMNSKEIGEKEKEDLEKIVLQRFGPAFVNRIDNVIYFNQLNLDCLSKILDYQISELNKSLEDKRIKFAISSAVAEEMIVKAHSSVYGARLMKRLVQTYFVSALTQILLRKNNDSEIYIRCYATFENQAGERIGDYVYQY